LRTRKQAKKHKEKFEAGVGGWENKVQNFAHFMKFKVNFSFSKTFLLFI
jgi:hypothetical protein